MQFYSYQNAPATKDSPWVRWVLIGLCLTFMSLMLIAPLMLVFYQALSFGFGAYIDALTDPEAWHAIRLTLYVSAVVLPINIIIGLGIAYLVTRHRFFGRGIITTLLDLPFAVSPVVAGLMFVLVFGVNTPFGRFLEEGLGIQVIYAIPGIVLATLFVTFPFIARELIPVMQEMGVEEEEAALTLGANGWQMFWHVILPNVRFALLYGIILTNARAMGEFGAVSIVSGHIRGQTNTVPLLIEIAYNEYAFITAFALSSLLGVLALLTIIAQSILESRTKKETS